MQNLHKNSFFLLYMFYSILEIKYVFLYRYVCESMQEILIIIFYKESKQVNVCKYNCLMLAANYVNV